MKPLRVAIGTDHGGLDKKNEIVSVLRKQGHFILDCGTQTPDSTDYPIYAARVARAVSHSLVDFGIIICRTGNGMTMTANRFTGVRAANAGSQETARLARQHNNANMLVIGCDFSRENPVDLITPFLEEEFEGGRHARRVQLIDDIDRQADSPLATWRVLRHGQSIWMDRSQPGSFTRSLAEQRVTSEGLRGIVVSGEMRDILDAADALLPVHKATGGDDGYACMHAPSADSDDPAAIRDAVLEVHREHGRPNVMVSIPDSAAGLAAAGDLLAEGVSVCVAGILSPAEFDIAAQSVLDALQQALDAGKPVHQPRVVFAVEVSFVDAVVNRRIEELAAARTSREQVLALLRLRDRAALANCQRVHSRFTETFFGEPFRSLAAAGAALPRLLWSGTAPSSPDMNPLYYASELIAPYTISLVANTTWEAFLDTNAIVRDRLLEKGGEEDELRSLAEQGVDLDALLLDLREARVTSALHG